MDQSLVVLDSRRFSLPLDDQGRIAPSRLASAIAAVAGLVLVIAVTNLVGITVARSVVRRSEIAVRLTLGATRRRLARQLVTEGLLLSTAGGLMGVVWSQALVSMFLATLPSTAGSPLEIAFDVPIDLQVLLFTMLVVVGVGIAIGLAPARQASRTDLVSALANASELAPRRLRSRLRHWIVIPQICVCTGLLLAAGVSTRALLKVALVDPGYRPEGVVTTSISVPFVRSTLPNESAELRQTRNTAYGARMAELQRRVLEEITALPGTVAAGFASTTPLGSMPPYAVVTRDDASRLGSEASLNSASVTPGYFAAIGLPLRAGRLFEARDASQVPRIAIVDDATVKRLWPGRPAVGQSLGVHNGNVTRWVWLDVVGVVGNVYAPLSEGEPKPFVYLPAGEPKSELGPLIARGHTTDAELIRNIRATVAQIDPEAVVTRSRPLVAAIEEVRYPRRMAAALLVSSALVGLLLAGVGLYGVVSYSVVQRLKELGIRAALGANRADLTRLVVREAANVTVIGSLIGFGLAIVGIRLVSRQVFAMPGLDWITAAVVPAVLGAVVFAACYLPARRASRVDPLVVLRWQ